MTRDDVMSAADASDNEFRGSGGIARAWHAYTATDREDQPA